MTSSMFWVPVKNWTSYRYRKNSGVHIHQNRRQVTRVRLFNQFVGHRKSFAKFGANNRLKEFRFPCISRNSLFAWKYLHSHLEGSSHYFLLLGAKAIDYCLKWFYECDSCLSKLYPLQPDDTLWCKGTTTYLSGMFRQFIFQTVFLGVKDELQSQKANKICVRFRLKARGYVVQITSISCYFNFIPMTSSFSR